MPGFEVERSIADIIDIGLKKYHDEDMIWLYNEVLKLTERTDHSSRRDTSWRHRDDRQKLSIWELEEFKSFSEVTSRIKIKLKEINDREILESFFLETEKRNDLIDKKDHFTFLKQNKRICSFAVNYLNNKDNRRESDCYFKYTENPYLYIIYYFTISRKRFRNSDINKINSINLDKIKKNYHNNSKNFDDQDFLEWAYSYLRDKSEEFNKIRYRPKAKIDYKNLIVSFLDYLLYFNENKHYLLTNQLYKAWSQRKFRAADKIKKPYHLPLTKVAKSKLKKLADFKNKTENEIIEELIHQIYLNEMCDENGESKY